LGVIYEIGGDIARILIEKLLIKSCRLTMCIG